MFNETFWHGWEKVYRKLSTFHDRFQQGKDESCESGHCLSDRFSKMTPMDYFQTHFFLFCSPCFSCSIQYDKKIKTFLHLPAHLSAAVKTQKRCFFLSSFLFKGFWTSMCRTKSFLWRKYSIKQQLHQLTDFHTWTEIPNNTEASVNAVFNETWWIPCLMTVTQLKIWTSVYFSCLW